MEFIEDNFINTTTGLTLDSNTTVANYIYNQDVTLQYVTSGFNDDNTSASITWSFDETTTVSRLILREINLKDFSIYYDGTTTNLFTLTSTGSTVSSSFTSNSETALYMKADAIDCTSVTLLMNATIVANSEKAVGWFVISDNEYTISRIPNAGGYKPNITPEQIIHTLSDGGTRVQNIAEKWKVNLKWKYIDLDFRNNLKAIYDQKKTWIFTSFETMTGWDEVCFPAVWTNGFEFYQYSDEAVGAGFEGQIKLAETTNA